MACTSISIIFFTKWPQSTILFFRFSLWVINGRVKYHLIRPSSMSYSCETQALVRGCDGDGDVDRDVDRDRDATCMGHDTYMYMVFATLCGCDNHTKSSRLVNL